MKLARFRQPRDLVNITPLIDVVFILLVFFMLAGAIKRPEVVPVTPPASQAEEPGMEEELIVLVGADGAVVFNGQLMSDDSVLIRTAALWLLYHPDSAIQLKADADAEAARVIEVMERLRDAGARSLVLLTVGGEGASLAPGDEVAP